MCLRKTSSPPAGLGITSRTTTTSVTALQQVNGFQSGPFNANFTRRNANKHIQFDGAISWFKSG